MNKLVWLINVALAVLLLLAGWHIFIDDDSGKTTRAAEPTTTTTILAKDLIPPGPNAKELQRQVVDLDLSAFTNDGDFDNWEVGLISEVKGPSNIMLMMTSKQIGVFYGSYSDKDGCEMPDDYLATLLDDGDIVLWDTAGDDNRLCMDELILVKEKK